MELRTWRMHMWTAHVLANPRRMPVWIFACLMALTVCMQDAGAQLVQPCGSLDNGNNGPFDYLVERGRKLSVVEEFHFTAVVESLIRGQSSSSVGGDLDYTLTVFPNHHRALISLMRLGEKSKLAQPGGTRFPVECYFERALRFRPDDTIARMIYATFLAQQARKPEALQQLERLVESAGDNPFSHNNIGLIYFDLKEYEKALQQAHKAIALGFTSSILRDQLQSAGKWVTPEATGTATGAAVDPPTQPANSQPPKPTN